jgi:hypothetical protein
MDKTQAPRTYIYYSDDKVRELDQQLPLPPWWRRALSRIRGGGATGPGGIGLNIDIGSPEPEAILRSMQRIWRHLDAEGLVGTFDEPKTYFYGELEFYYGIFDSVQPPVFFLVGATDRTIVGLGGSQKHVRGHRDHEIRAEENARNVTMEPDVATLIYTASETDSPEAPMGIPSAMPGDDMWAIHLAGMYSNWQGWQGRKMKFEVLARQEGLSQLSPPFVESSRDVLIGSPIFVAQT